MRDLARQLVEAVEVPIDVPHGDCYRQAAKYATAHDLSLVHGTVKSPVRPRPFTHAWVEDGEKVIDPTTGIGIKTKQMTRKRYYDLLNIDYRKNHVYSPEKAVGIMATAGHWGPYTKKEWEEHFGKGWKPGKSKKP